mgnify:CR=1 FL=1
MLLNAFLAIINFLLRGVVFLSIAVFGGLGTAWALIHSGSYLTTTREGPWATWHSAGRKDADPYTRANIVRTTALPISSTLALTWRAVRDADNSRLHSSCAYHIDMGTFEAEWWSLNVFDDTGRLIPNSAQRHAFNTATAARDPNGAISIVVSRDARPGNWLPTTGAGRFVLVLTVQDPNWVAAVVNSEREVILPPISTLECR